MSAGTLNAAGGGSIVTVTYAAAAALVAGATVVPSQMYRITGCDTGLYGGTDVFVFGLTTTSFSIEGSGLFYNPKYNQALSGFGIWHSGIPAPTAGVTQYIYGGKLWTSATGVVGTATDIYTLSAAWTVVAFNTTDYNVVLDDIDYDFTNDRIIGREDIAGNTINTSYQQNIAFTATYNPIKCFQWGNNYTQSTGIGVGNNDIEAAYLECINFRGKNILRNKVSGASKIYSNNFTAGTTEVKDNIWFTGAETYSNTFTNFASNYFDGASKVYSNNLTSYNSNTITGAALIYSNTGTSITSNSVNQGSFINTNSSVTLISGCTVNGGTIISDNTTPLQIVSSTFDGAARVRLNSGAGGFTINFVYNFGSRINSNVCNVNTSIFEFNNMINNSQFESNTIDEASVSGMSFDKGYITGCTLTGDGAGTTTNIINTSLIGSGINASTFTGGGDFVARVTALGSVLTLTGGSTLSDTQVIYQNVTLTSGAKANYLYGVTETTTLSVQGLTHNPGDTTAYYMGMNPKAPSTTAGINKIYVRKPCTIKGAEIYSYAATVTGTNENWSFYIRVNNTTDHLIQTVGAATAERVFTNSAMTIPQLAAGDYFEIKSIPPAWATNPTGVTYGGYVSIQFHQ
jgi:hypothetical protein